MPNKDFIDVKIPLIEECVQKMKKSAKKYQQISESFEREIQKLSEDEALKSMVIDEGMLEMIQKNKIEAEKMLEQCNAYANYLQNIVITNYQYAEKENQKEIDTLDDMMNETAKNLGEM